MIDLRRAIKRRRASMRILRSKKLIVAVSVVAVAGALAATGLSAVWAQIVQADTTGGVHLRVVSTSASDFDSGWHTHPGLVVVQVLQGSFQITQGSCTARAVNAGDTYIEVPYVPVRAVAVGRIVWTTTYILKTEDPVLTPAASPCG
jgi:quercetin dioxygenase-like cupin family protein